MMMKKKTKKMLENETPHFFKVFLQDDVLSPTLVSPSSVVVLGRKAGAFDPVLSFSTGDP